MSTNDSESRKESSLPNSPANVTEATRRPPKVAPLDMTPVEVIRLLFNFTPEVGGDIEKIAVTATMRLHFTVQVSSSS